MRAPNIKLPEPLDGKLTAIAKRRHTTRAKALREALDAFDEQTAKRTTVESIVGDLIGSLEGPGDLLSNPKHMAGYGR
jgi:ribbon-helix-helix CopG family protein